MFNVIRGITFLEDWSTDSVLTMNMNDPTILSICASSRNATLHS